MSWIESSPLTLAVLLVDAEVLLLEGPMGKRMGHLGKVEQI